MDEKPDLIAIPIVLFWIILAGYYAYRSWFDPDGLIASMRCDVKRLPSWYPTKDYSLSKIGTKPWLWQMRIFSTFFTFIGIFALLLILYLFVR